MTRVDSQFEDFFKIDGEPEPLAPAPHRGGMLDAARLLDKHARHDDSVERPYVQGDLAKLFFGPRPASRLFTKSAPLRSRLRAGMGESAGDDPLLCAFLSGDESAARREVRRAVKEDFPARFVVPPIDPGPRDDDFSFDDFFSEEGQ